MPLSRMRSGRWLCRTSMVSPSENADDGAGEISKRGRDTVQTQQKVRCESRHSSPGWARSTIRCNLA